MKGLVLEIFKSRSTKHALFRLGIYFNMALSEALKFD